jgi:hypothetical protein
MVETPADADVDVEADADADSGATDASLALDDLNDPAVSTDGEGDDDRPPIACTLTTREADERADWIESTLLPHLVAVEEREDGFSLVLDRTADAVGAAAELAWKESHCCAWATFEVEFPPDDGTVRWNARSDRADGAAFFDEGLRRLRREVEDLPAPNSG